MANSKRERRNRQGMRPSTHGRKIEDEVLPEVQMDPWMSKADLRLVREMLRDYSWRVEKDLERIHRTPRRAREVRAR